MIARTRAHVAKAIAALDDAANVISYRQAGELSTDEYAAYMKFLGLAREYLRLAGRELDRGQRVLFVRPLPRGLVASGRGE